MKVEFKLTLEQFNRANEIRAKAEKSSNKMLGGTDAPVEAGKYNYAGNLIGMVEIFPGYNPNQRLDLIAGPGWSVLRYEGERHPFQGDGGLKIVQEILGRGWRLARWSEYETSDKRLRWYETKKDWIGRAGQFNDFLYSPHHMELPERFQELRACLQDLQREVPDRRIWASYKPDVVKNARIFHKKILGTWTPERKVA